MFNFFNKIDIEYNVMTLAFGTQPLSSLTMTKKKKSFPNAVKFCINFEK